MSDASPVVSGSEAARQLEAALEGALDLPPSERTAWLAEAVDDAALRRRVLEMLDRADRAGDRLERPAAEVVAGSEGDEGPERPPPLPEHIGPFRIFGVLGRGGMGLVYGGEQSEPVERRVAIKVVGRSLAGPAQRDRFATERRILARLAHPAIAAFVDAGETADAHPWLALELVEGETILAGCDHDRLSIDERIDLFLRVCEGVAHAHRRGVLHRDLKPSNVLVTTAVDTAGRESLQPKIIDFGISRLVDAEATVGDPIGTPAYTSPEVFLGDQDAVDVRVDVYSLGVLLSELLSGERPYGSRDSSAERILWEATHGAAVLPSRRFRDLPVEAAEERAAQRSSTPAALVRALRGNLDAIVARATARDPEERYADVAELAADLRFHLRDEPVRAREESSLARLRRTLRRHRTAFLVAGAILAALLVGLVQARREAAATRRALAEATELADFLTDLFEVSTPERSRGARITARELLDRGAQDIGGRFRDQPLARARLLRTLGEAYTRLGFYDDAGPLLEESRKVVADTPEAKIEDRVASLRSLGVLEWRDGQLDEAEELFDEALRVAETLPSDRLGRLALATTLSDRGIFELSRQRYGDARNALERALGIREAIFGRRHREVAEVLGNLGYVLSRDGEVEAGETMIREALGIGREVLGPDHPEVAADLYNLGLVLRRQGRLGEAERSIREALAIWTKLYGEDHPQAHHALLTLATMARQEGRPEEAEALYRRQIEAIEAFWGPDHAEVLLPLNALGALVREQGRFEEAATILRRSLRLRMATWGRDDPRMGMAEANLGLALWNLGEREEAESHLQRSLEIWSDPDDVRRSWSLWGLAGLRRDQGRREEAEPLYREALGLVESVPEGSQNLPPVREDLEGLLAERGRARHP